MEIEQQDYLQQLLEVYQAQCNQYLQERISLQAQLNLVLIEIEKLKTKKIEEVVDVNTSNNT